MRAWLKWLVLGALSIAFGAFVLANPVAGSVAVTLLAGAMFLVAGAFQTVVGLYERGLGPKLLGVGLGVLMSLLGMSLVFHPLQGVVSLALVVTLIIATTGVIRLVLALRMKATPFFWSMLITGALSILLAGYIAANFFDVAPALLGLLVGIEMVFNGLGLIVLAFYLRSHPEMAGRDAHGRDTRADEPDDI